jgi:circadian clock protein KaiA
LHVHQSAAEFLIYLENHQEEIDCIILDGQVPLQEVANQLCRLGLILPAIVILEDQKGQDSTPSWRYHSAEVHLGSTCLERLAEMVDQAIAQFVRLAPLQCVTTVVAPTQPRQGNTVTVTAIADPILQQQQRLTERLKERLGYLGVYYKRDPQQFLRNLSPQEAKQVLQLLIITYREIVINYFSKAGSLNASIERFIDLAFFSDIPVTQIVEIHMDLMDEFSKQLKLEGRSEEILLDYRLTLIDVIAHLCEMYRRSIPRDS